MPFTVLVCRFSSVIICSGVSFAAHAASVRPGSAFKNVASQTATPIMYEKGVAILTIGSSFVPKSERSRKATSCLRRNTKPQNDAKGVLAPAHVKETELEQ